MKSIARAILRASKLSSGQTHGVFPTRATQLRQITHAPDLQFGQPLHETHPHLLKSGELTPGISAFEYAQRRARLAESLPSGSVAIVAAANVKYKSGAVFYKFHQDPNFLYLTGFNEPDALAIIEKAGTGSEHTFHLYVRPKDLHGEKWEGARSGVEAAQDVFNADEAGDVGNIISVVSHVIGNRRDVYTDIPTDAKSNSNFTKIVFGSRSSATGSINDVLKKNRVRPLRPFMNELRAVKSPAEIGNMREAGQASGRAFNDAMTRDFQTEKDLETFLDFKFKENGCEGSAYVPVVAGGENALQIHYVRNDAAFKDGQLVQVDGGGEYGGYVTDITRVWPVLSEKFDPAQRDLYEMVLKVQKDCVSLCHEDAGMSLDRLHDLAEQGLKDGLKRLGFDTSNKARQAYWHINRYEYAKLTPPQAQAIDTLFPHHLGHFLGLAVHDAPGYPRTGRLRKGNCITIEPGIYVDHSERWPSHFRGMGFRIEDSVCVGENQPIVLSKDAVKEINDIEALRQGKTYQAETI